MNIEARLRKLEKRLNEDKPQMVVLFGEDEAPADTPSNARIVRLHEEDRGA